MTDDLLLLPNVAALVTAFLRAQPEIVALVGDRVVTELGKDQEYPAVRITQFTDRPTIPRPLVHTAATLQLEAFGGPKALAWKIAETARAALCARFNGRQSYTVNGNPIEGRITGCDASGMRDLPDATFTPAKPRYLFTITAYARAA